jgi:chromosome partitioning protein
MRDGLTISGTFTREKNKPMKETRPSLPRTLAVVSQKGGSGKTTAAVNLAAALGERGRRVLVVDLDPQASASSWLGIRDGGRGLFDAFTGNGNLADLVHLTDVSNVSVIPSSSWLIGLEKALAAEVGAETVLRRLLDRLPKEWDHVFLDCPPSLGVLTVNALTAVPGILVPVAAQYMALQGLAQLLQTVDMVKERLNPGLRISAVLACRVDVRTNLSEDVVQELRKKFGPLVFRTVIHENTRTAEAPSFRKPVTIYDPRSAGAEDFRRLAAEVIANERRTKE